MKLEIAEDQGRYFYYLKNKSTKVHRTHTCELAKCGTNAEGRVAYIEVFILPVSILEALKEALTESRELSIQTDGKIQIVIEGIESESTSSCIVNFDLDVDGSLVGIEVT